eukprot:GDKI01002774.1.p1 GENE.GDKI01002774.1~~GDKI01002774.1.p1  ORF type:complete len:160 (+),score=36.72 GDKI01002774.1:56-481(+)
MLKRHGYTLVQIDYIDALYVHDSILHHFDRLSTRGDIQALYNTGYMHRDMYDGMSPFEETDQMFMVWRGAHYYYFKGREIELFDRMQQAGITSSNKKTDTNTSPEHVKTQIIHELWTYIQRTLQHTHGANATFSVPYVLTF